jgi:hypothetical protein
MAILFLQKKREGQEGADTAIELLHQRQDSMLIENIYNFNFHSGFNIEFNVYVPQKEDEKFYQERVKQAIKISRPEALHTTSIQKKLDYILRET